MDLRHFLRLYVIPDQGIGAPRALLAQTEAALAGGATTIQLRDKHLPGRELLALGMAMAGLCRRAGALFIVNDRLDIALLCGAHGVHLGQDDLPADAARRLCPPGFIVGVSAQSEEQARLARAHGADYLGIGAVYPTQTKDAAALGLAGVRAVARATDLPTVAIGGINLDNAAEVMGTGVDGLSIISAVVAAPDISLAARDFLEVIEHSLK